MPPLGIEWSEFVHAKDRLLARRRAQRGHRTFGDDEDRHLSAALAALPGVEGAPLPAVRDAGRVLGVEVFARRVFEDSMRGALIILSTCLLEAGWGSLRVEDTFHRSARVRYLPGPAMQAADGRVVSEFVAGILDGYMGEAFNCVTRVQTLSPCAFELTLREGRDVNGGVAP